MSFVYEYFTDAEFMEILEEAISAARTDAEIEAIESIECRWMFDGLDQISDEEIALLERLVDGVTA
jgi:hypothetical protein